MAVLRSFALPLGLAFCLAGCGGPPGLRPDGNTDEARSPGKAIKVTYIRFDQDPQKRRYVGSYRVMLSRSWKLKNGATAREPFARIFRHPFLGESIPDEALEELVREMKKFGLDELRDCPIESINLDELARVQGTASQEVAARWRIINIETDTMKKTVRFNDNFVPGLVEKFARVEREVIKVAVQWTIQVTTETAPLTPR